ncbi:B12-binding domain-containing radical SAM protein [Bacteroides sp.]|uniref:B12-binding domain-containing radical SAM protein n=1 Tax=Bacteroides sp. TaxID=29523 RepID=UPI002FCB90D1
MKLLWLDLNSSYAHSSLALPALHAQIATDTSIEWEVVSATIGENVGMIVNNIYSHCPDIIAATTWLFNHEQLLHIVSRAKALLPHCTIILGGPEFLGNNEAFLRKNPFVNGVFRGEGEEVFPSWLKVWNRPDSWSHITGLCYLESNERYCDNGIARVMNFDRLISPEESRFFNWSKPFVQLETTRGCFNTCAFCVSGGEKPIRTIDMATIRQRLTEIHRRGIKNVRVLDRTFNYDNKRAKELLTLFLEFSPDICFHLEIHPALLSAELKEELAKLPQGLLHLEAGIQSLREEVLVQSRRMGKLSKALEGLQFLCSLPQMETHADLIAGLPLYHLSEIFEDVHTLAGYGAGEIQLESLKLLPGTEMRRRAEELGIQYSPLPPYEVLQTREITVEELQTARYLSRLLDGFYNVPTWRSVTQQLMLAHPAFLSDLLHYVIQLGLIDQPLSMEKRGLILYEFCQKAYPEAQALVSIAWIEAGMSLKKLPAEKVRTKRQVPFEEWQVIYGEYHETLRLCFLPIHEEKGYWFGFESEAQKLQPVFKATNLQRDSI